MTMTECTTRTPMVMTDDTEIDNIKALYELTDMMVLVLTQTSEMYGMGGLSTPFRL